ncbi:phenylalanine--tRNA ligase subunit beta [Brachyspira pilosicoli]|uniref:Phenylalanine--tRNA ligase beta subunit n=2 Tax=Brachyspira pilosicoli TaxID=52584 RepID=A0A3B6VSP8_BRAPL|nr:phenylalanine--tRNA ligase subunit beta [Brachyspira pilosicoli]AGA66455.1 phenylalanyl-tRNA synthetase subunit alpha [Brachyspira pilosicoli P43/6/78]MBW5378471.1 phenylalanine--tRNA ligase subunit beta [Brachyspira pilosicoli]MBW5393123.1 phenylalanine--tRNA ligase subunit beta [Brachyspira pilosicoli]MBW5399555.1 phenylalanine--tRNA ligase subunit beta [Brachyspira pilosicoli]WIH84648.1 phenylalanine--tRNA ligase subunit beta [Brachyspira pilosicoli]
MRIPLSWLKEFVNLDGLEVEEIARNITLSGSEISSIETTGGDIPGVIIGKVLTVHKHPDADKLSVCKVNVGDDVLSIVCGAPNVRENIYVPVAMIGAKLPNGLTIKKASIRGFESSGMLCSRTELGYEEIEGVYGIWILDEHIDKLNIEDKDSILGNSLSTIVGSTDHIFNVEITANRGDLVSIIGFARECSLVLEKRVSIPSVNTYDSTGGNIDITVENQESCYKYVGRLINNITVGPSPDWMQNRLKKCGINPINNIVDITNYVMLEYGQPLHAYDFDKVKDGKIIVRNAKNDEKITLLDGREINLTDEVLVIADSEKPIGVAGVMGGDSTKIEDTTKNILIESAYFDHIAVKKSTIATNTKTDASYRFEREIDHTLTLAALNRAVDLIVTLDNNAKIVSRAKEVNVKQFEATRIVFDCGLVKRYLGLDMNKMQVSSIFKRYGFNASALGENNLKVDIPFYRHDLTIAEDLIEEIARVYGYNNLDSNVPHIKCNPIKTDYADISFVKHRMASYGLYETKQYSLGDSKMFKNIGFKDEQLISVVNPLTSEMDVLRPTTLVSLLNSIAYNQNHRHKNGALFEVGNIFYKENDKFVEEKHLSAVMFGLYQEKLWNKESRAYDFFDMSGVVEELITKDLNSTDYNLIPKEHDWFIPTMSADIVIFGEKIGIIGRIHPKILALFDINTDVYFTDINIRYAVELIKKRVKKQQLKDIGKYPAVFRDLALVCDRNIEFSKVIKSISKFNDIIQNVDVVDRYVGEQVKEGKQSIAISITYYDPNKTLREEDINAVESSLLEMLKTRFSIELRS